MKKRTKIKAILGNVGNSRFWCEKNINVLIIQILSQVSVFRQKSKRQILSVWLLRIRSFKIEMKQLNYQCLDNRRSSIPMQVAKLTFFSNEKISTIKRFLRLWYIKEVKSAINEDEFECLEKVSMFFLILSFDYQDSNAASKCNAFSPN